MKAIEILAREHRELYRILSYFERVLEDATRTDRLDAALALDIVDFLTTHTDGCHQDKEERMLFPKLMERAPASQGGFLRSLMGIHEHERALLGELRRLLEEAARGEGHDLGIIVERGHAYVELQREHARREDRMLFPLAEDVLGRADDAEMIIGFRRIDEEHGGGSMAEQADAIRARVLTMTPPPDAGSAVESEVA